MMTHLRITILCLLALCASAAQGAGLLLNDTFEAYSTGNMTFTNGWSAEGGRLTPQVVTTSVDSVPPHGGSHMVSFNWDGPAQNFETMLMSMSSRYNNELFMRYWVRWASDWTWSTGVSAGHFLRFFQESPYMDWLDGNPSPGSWTSDVIVNGVECSMTWLGIPNSSWHKYEKYINRATGVVKMWIDDVLRVNTTGCNFGSLKYNNFYIMSNWGEVKPDSTNHMYLDDFEVWSDTGSSSFTGSMSNGDIAPAGGGIAPTVTSVSCTPTLNQAPATTSCTASATGDVPITWAWTGQGTNCSWSNAAVQSPTLTCSFGGGRAPCAQATNAFGSHQLCMSTNGVVWRYVKPTGIGAN
jgi:hypothetical protein